MPDFTRDDIEALRDLAAIADPLSKLLAGATRDRWAGGVMLQAMLPVVPSVAALPTAATEWRGKLARVEGDGALTNDRLYLCRLLSTGAYEWTVIL